MNEALIAILGGAWTLLTAVVMFVLGQRSERKRQTLLIRAQMLDPINKWLNGVEKFIGILGDTLGSVSFPSPGPLTYNFEERRKSAQFMIENTNEVLGILESERLSTRRTKDTALKLAEVIRTLDHQVKNELLPLDHEILLRASQGNLTEGFIRQVGEIKLALEKMVQDTYSLIAKLKTSLT